MFLFAIPLSQEILLLPYLFMQKVYTKKQCILQNGFFPPTPSKISF